MNRTEPGGLTRARLVSAALELVQVQGLDGLSMRPLAERLQVKAASLYWHVRDRGELVDLLAEAIVARLPEPAAGRPWREAARNLARTVSVAAAAQRDAARIVLSAPGALERSAAHAGLADLFAGAGLPAAEADPAATMLLLYALLMPPPAGSRKRAAGERAPASIAVDSGSRGVTLRAAQDTVDDLIRVPHDARSAAPAVVRGETVVVRRLRGAGSGEIELNPAHPWSVRIQGPTWNTTLQLAGLDVRGVKLDSGAVRAEIYLPRPRGKVSLEVSGGTGGVKLHRPPGSAVVARVGSGAVRVRLDGFALAASIGDSRWESRPGAASGDHYDLYIGGGAVNVTLDDDAPETAEIAAAEELSEPAAAVDILLDGIALRGKARHSSA